MVASKENPLDVVSLSLGYYHETPGAVDDEAGLFAALRQLQRDGVCVVAAAGNGATTLEFWPAALATRPLSDDGQRAAGAPLVSVGASNPADGTVAPFSNTGRWVLTYRPGVAVVSTMPTGLNGSLRGGLFVDARGSNRKRGTPDPDDYSSGFGVWSGSSFAAPACAGQVAHALCREDAEQERQARVARVTGVVDDVIREPGGGDE